MQASGTRFGPAAAAAADGGCPELAAALSGPDPDDTLLLDDLEDDVDAAALHQVDDLDDTLPLLDDDGDDDRLINLSEVGPSDMADEPEVAEDEVGVVEEEGEEELSLIHI